MVWLSFLVRINFMRPRARLNEKTMADSARKKERKISFTAFTGFSPPPPSRDSRDAEEKATRTLVSYRVGHSRDFSQLPQMGSLLAGYLLWWTLTEKNKTRSSIFNESWKGLCFLQPPSPKVKRRTPSESLEKGWEKLSRPEMHV